MSQYAVKRPSLVPLARKCHTAVQPPVACGTFCGLNMLNMPNSVSACMRCVEIQATDAGRYTCEASNDFATASCSATLTVVNHSPASRHPSDLRSLHTYQYHAPAAAPPPRPIVVNVNSTSVSLSWQPPDSLSSDVIYSVEYFNHDQPAVRKCFS